jgi:hypothetical protein
LSSGKEKTMLDKYTKAVLTIIALGLISLVAENAVDRATAASGDCGSFRNPCYVANVMSTGRSSRPWTECSVSNDPCFVVHMK